MRKKSNAAILTELLLKKGLKIAFAESCTGGLLADSLVNIAGASGTFLGSAVSYANSAKREMLGVSEKSLDCFGAVSEQVAIEMASGIRKRLSADVALSTTGIAGPGGGSREKPVGLVYIGYSDGKTEFARRFNFSGQKRREVRENTVAAALYIALEMLSDDCE